MKKFLAVYLGSPQGLAAWKNLDEAVRKQKESAGMQGWKDWMATNGKSLVDGGCPLGATKRVASNGVSDTRNSIAGYTIVQAESHEAAAKLFEKHPHFTLFPGEAAEIMECLPTPGM